MVPNRELFSSCGVIDKMNACPLTDLSKLTSYFDEYNHNNIDLYNFILVIKSLQQTKCIKLIYSYTCIYIYNTRASKYAFQTNFVIHTQHTHLKLSYRILDQIRSQSKSNLPSLQNEASLFPQVQTNTNMMME